MLSHLVSALAIPALVSAATVTYSVPAAAPTTAATLDVAPVAISIEFFTWPSYMTNVTATTQCLSNFEALTGEWPAIRIGGTTQDRADYNPSTSAYVVYSTSSATGVPTILTYGPSFIDLAAAYKGRVTMGLNRGHNNITNTILAAKYSKSKMTNLYAIEAGNEPEYWSGATAAADAQAQDDWAIRIGQAISTTDIMEEGNSLSPPPTWGAAELIATENSTVTPYVKTFSHHAYPGGDTTTLMEHSLTVSKMAVFKADIAAATTAGKQYVFGETNSVSGGGAASVSPTYSSAIWTLDYALYATTLNAKRLYFHHGTLGACEYCWFGRYTMGASYYGAYAASAAMASGSKIVMLDAGTTNYATYIVYGSTGAPLRAVLINTDFYSGSGTRGSEVFKLTGFSTTSVKAKRLTAAASTSRVDEGASPTFGGQEFENGSCVKTGTEAYETTTVSSGAANFTVNASEALIVYF
ncbi:Beta-glucuronidase [Lachnellula hyalina]|uniref:Beta-glucuronidase n=1 Tax=Lachnellula hyalina TaxID=1316788 RepID=A0A8H8QZA5_9HELO|nr:Beta-glucuronidase [Lachnellula hyalina]TVY24801.1 Beta-glucuronidase [Lachnellula hyalina]